MDLAYWQGMIPEPAWSPDEELPQAEEPAWSHPSPHIFVLVRTAARILVHAAGRISNGDDQF